MNPSQIVLSNFSVGLSALQLHPYSFNLASGVFDRAGIVDDVVGAPGFFLVRKLSGATAQHFGTRHFVGNPGTLGVAFHFLLKIAGNDDEFVEIPGGACFDDRTSATNFCLGTGAACVDDPRAERGTCEPAQVTCTPTPNPVDYAPNCQGDLLVLMGWTTSAGSGRVDPVAIPGELRRAGERFGVRHKYHGPGAPTDCDLHLVIGALDADPGAGDPVPVGDGQAVRIRISN